jgi:hypothetical protein
VKADTIRYTKTIQLPPQVQYRERISVPQKIGVAIGSVLFLLLLFALIRK